MYVEKIEKEYNEFFEKMNINIITGYLENVPKLKFVTMPFIGSKYSNAKERILFIGMDVGKDETPGRFQSLEERNRNVEREYHFNPHIAGTYCSALFLLKEKYNWESKWIEFTKYSSFYQATKTKFHKEGENPLSYIALTNLHKFVTNGRNKRSGSGDRNFIETEIEEDLLLKEIRLLNPNVIVFQGGKLRYKIIGELKKMNIRLLYARHPSYRKKNGRDPTTYINTFKEI